MAWKITFTTYPMNVTISIKHVRDLVMGATPMLRLLSHITFGERIICI